MKFKEFLDKTGYSPTHAAHALLYKKYKRPLKMAESLGYEPTEEERTLMKRLIAGKGDFSELGLTEKVKAA